MKSMSRSWSLLQHWETLNLLAMALKLELNMEPVITVNVEIKMAAESGTLLRWNEPKK